MKGRETLHLVFSLYEGKGTPSFTVFMKGRETLHLVFSLYEGKGNPSFSVFFI